MPILEDVLAVLYVHSGDAICVSLIVLLRRYSMIMLLIKQYTWTLLSKLRVNNNTSYHTTTYKWNVSLTSIVPVEHPQDDSNI